MQNKAATPGVPFERITTAQGDERYEVHNVTHVRDDGSEWHAVRVWDTHEGGNGYVWAPGPDNATADAIRKAKALNKRWIAEGKSAYHR